MSINLVKIICCDVDGTMTNGNFYVTETGVIFKNFHTKDMYSLYKAAKDGFKILFITGSTDKVIHAKVDNRYPIISGSKNKFTDLSKYLLDNNFTWENVAYIGDGENDYKCILESSFSACPSDALPEIVENCNFSSNYGGGSGAVYDIIRYIYRLRKMEWSLEEN